MFKLGYLMESSQLPPQPKRSTSWLKPVVGAGAAAGLAYMGDRYLNNGAGASWLKQQFAGGNQPVQPKAVPMPNLDPAAMTADPPDYRQVGQTLSDANQAFRAASQQAADEGGRDEASRQLGQVIGGTVQAAPAVHKFLTAAKPQAGLAAAGAQSGASTAGSTASKLGLASTAGTMGKLTPGLGGLFGALNDDIAERGFADVNLGEPANRALGGVAGAVTSLHPVGLAGNILGNAGLGAYNWHTGRLAETNSHAGDVGDSALTLMRALREQPDQTLPYARGFLQMPVVRNMMDNPAERHPASNQLLQRLMEATQQLEQR